jgi:hypothetical protein
LDKYNRTKDPNILHPLEPILQILNIEEIVSNIEMCEDIDYDPEFMWDINPNYFTYIDLNKKAATKKKSRRNIHGCSFYDALKTRFEGLFDMDYPYYYLENMDELEMAESRINNLEGIEYCINTENIDLSGNMISDLTPLYGLKQVKELNLADNCISDIDVLATLHQLRNLNLCNNPIHDVSPLLELDTLENLDITGNSNLVRQIRLLEERGVVVNVD